MFPETRAISYETVVVVISIVTGIMAVLLDLADRKIADGVNDVADMKNKTIDFAEAYHESLKATEAQTSLGPLETSVRNLLVAHGEELRHNHLSLTCYNTFGLKTQYAILRLSVLLSFVALVTKALLEWQTLYLEFTLSNLPLLIFAFAVLIFLAFSLWLTVKPFESFLEKVELSEIATYSSFRNDEYVAGKLKTLKDAIHTRVSRQLPVEEERIVERILEIPELTSTREELGSAVRDPLHQNFERN